MLSAIRLVHWIILFSLVPEGSTIDAYEPIAEFIHETFLFY